jgi:hypothetical protein
LRLREVYAIAWQSAIVGVTTRTQSLRDALATWLSARIGELVSQPTRPAARDRHTCEEGGRRSGGYLLGARERRREAAGAPVDTALAQEFA